MNQSRIDLALVLQHLGLPFTLDTFSQRLTLQKEVYLAQLTGADLGYRFNWYLRGPYSPGLTVDAFTLVDEVQGGDREFDEYTLQKSVEQQLDKAGELWALPERFDGSRDEWLELLASLHYLRHIAYRPKGTARNFDDCFHELAQAKPRFSHMKKQARSAWRRLKEFGLIDHKTLA